VGDRPPNSNGKAAHLVSSAQELVKLTDIDIEIAENMADKPIHWVGRSKDELLTFSDDARRRAGFELWTLQQGESPSDFKPMNSVGKGVEEIRIRVDDAYRIFYIARFDEAIYVLHAFQKTSQKTAQTNIQLGQQRYKQLLNYRKQQGS
jgi:phage-related protein